MKRGRASKAEVETNLVCIDAGRKRLDPPSDLTPEEQTVFRQIVAACSSTHFVESDKPLLVAYSTAIALSRRAARGIGESEGAFGGWERAVKMMGMLATRLRLAPQARLDPKTVGRAARNDLSGPLPWEPRSYIRRQTMMTMLAEDNLTAEEQRQCTRYLIATERKSACTRKSRDTAAMPASSRLQQAKRWTRKSESFAWSIRA